MKLTVQKVLGNQVLVLVEGSNTSLDGQTIWIVMGTLEHFGINPKDIVPGAVLDGERKDH